MSGGYIKLYRQILDNPVVCKDSDHFSIWVYLLLNATHENYDVVFGKERITLTPGQLITGRKSISTKLNIDESKVRRVLNLFENDQQISRQRSNKNSLITILKWSLYQGSDQRNEQQVTNKRPTSDQQVTTNKNVKNNNTQKNIKIKEESNRFTPPTLDENEPLILLETNWNQNDSVGLGLGLDIGLGLGLDIEKDIEQPEIKSKKHKYGSFKNVLLTDDELIRLKNDFKTIDFNKLIEWFSAYIEEKGYKSKSHNLAIRRWVIEAFQKNNKTVKKDIMDL